MLKKIIQNSALLEAQINTFLEDTTEPLPPDRVMENPNFRKWFGNSVTVNSDGTPMVFYHGTGSEFAQFNHQYSGAATSNYGTYGHGFYFTDNVDVADFYAGKAKGLDNIVPVYLKMEKIFTEADIPLYLEKYGMPKHYTGSVDYLTVAGLANVGLSLADAKDFSENLTKLGYDGIFARGADADQYIVFSPNQIKSIYNNGQFSTTSDNISEETK
jgi:hypothetical protein